MRSDAVILIIVLALACLAVPSAADGPLASAEGKLFGLTIVSGSPGDDDQGPPVEVLFPIYEKSGATAAFVGGSWGAAQPMDPGQGESTYDFSSFDNQLFMKSAKTKIAGVHLDNQWADKIKETDPERYWKLVEAFVTAFAKHANSRGVKHFHVPGNEYNLLGRPDWAHLYVEPLKHIHKGIKAASADNIVIAGNLSHGGDDEVQALYDAGAKGCFDVLDIHAYSNDPRTGVDIFQVVTAHRAMVRNGDADKKIFLGEGWGPARSVPGIVRKSPEEPPSPAEIEAMRQFVENGYRNMLTERDIYDPKWLLGAKFFTMNDNWGGGNWKKRAKPVDETGDGKPDYVMLDGYRFPPDINLEPTFYNGGLVDFYGKPKADLMDNFLPKIPEHKFEGSLTGEGPIFSYVTEKPYKLELKITNLSNDAMKLEQWGVRAQAGSKAILVQAQSDGTLPAAVEAGKDATGILNVTFPKEAAGRQVTLIGELEYSVGDRKHLTDCWVTVMVTPQLELTMLPARAILDSGEQGKRVGMSIINHNDAQFEGKITLSPSPGIQVKPAEFDTKIDPNGLEAYVFSVTADPKVAPGHYAVNVDIAGKVKDWVAVDVPVLAKPAKITVDGKLDDWKAVTGSSFAIVRPGSAGGYETIGRGMIAYDDHNFYAAFDVADAKHVQDRPMWDLWEGDSVQIAFDPLVNGARTQSGGYRSDDYEYVFAQTARGPVVYRHQAPAGKAVGVVSGVPFAFRAEGGRSYYEVAIPWTDLEPFVFKRGGMLAASVLVNNNDGAGRFWVEWGGGIAERKDPRRFVPVVLSE